MRQELIDMSKLRSLMPSRIAIPRSGDFTQEHEPKNAGRCDGGEPQSMKRCRWCYREKPIAAFYRNADKCKPCARLYAKITKQIRERGLVLVRR